MLLRPSRAAQTGVDETGPRGQPRTGRVTMRHTGLLAYGMIISGEPCSDEASKPGEPGRLSSQSVE